LDNLHGSFTSKEAEEHLKGKERGTFLLRWSNKQHKLVLSRIDAADGSMKHRYMSVNLGFVDFI
jgi:hypothetical protein